MGWLDKLLGRGKKTTGDVMGESSMGREGMDKEAEAAPAAEPAGQYGDASQSESEDES